jgi:MFS transporter, MHS family, dicarboxylic acid transporter PcaT
MFGGTAEYVALGLKSQGIEPTYFWYVTTMSAVILVCSLFLPRARPTTHLDAD